MGNSQRGLGFFGTLIFLAIVLAVGYYTYTWIMAPDAGPSCREAFNTCMRTCRRSTTEAPASQECQEGCQRDQAACERK